ncbi:MAG: hypothetical protein H6510_13305 [Acidobacteria bacterium]|nr:hypothetical protein [Acidobacteriota bacterium]MCB9398785.1 hypothetical protein [Acidobacteriota bacterium]
MVVCWSGLAPHPPIIVDGVGGLRAREANQTIAAMADLAQDMIQTQPELLILVSPHTPRPHSGLAFYDTTLLEGDFSAFGAPDSEVSLINDVTMGRHLQARIPELQALHAPLDHGATVPLWFFQEAGWQGPTFVLGLPWREDHYLEWVGDQIAHVLTYDDRKVALLASGDMSHCLKPGAPSGFDPVGREFDQQFSQLIQLGQFEQAAHLPKPLQESACQDVVASCRVIWQASHYAKHNHRLLSYEGPFGVGYSVACFYKEDPC